MDPVFVPDMFPSFLPPLIEASLSASMTAGSYWLPKKKKKIDLDGRVP